VADVGLLGGGSGVRGEEWLPWPREKRRNWRNGLEWMKYVKGGGGALL